MRTKTLKQRWIKARPGSVLILVIALLVLLALIGTAYLSSTQTERFTSHQNAINTEADLLLQGMINAVQSEIVGGVYGNNGSGITQYRPAYQEMPSTNGGTVAPPNGAYYHYDPIGTAQPGAKLDGTDPDPADMFLDDRIPTLQQLVTVPATLPFPIWCNASWPLFKDASGEYTFDSPLTGPGSSQVVKYDPLTYFNEQAMHLGVGVRKGSLGFAPTYYQLKDGSTVPAMRVYNVDPKTFVPGTGFDLTRASTYTNPDGSQFPAAIPTSGPPQQTIYAGSAAGDGVADSLFCKVPVGPINGITYYVATRIVDNNSAINASSAWDATADTAFASGDIGPNNGGAPTYGTGTNFGMFRSNVGLYSLLDTNQSFISMAAPPAASEMNALNIYRFGGAAQQPQSLTPAPTLTSVPLTTTASDPTLSQNAPIDFRWFSYGNVLDSQLISRSGNPGWATSNAAGGTSARMQWLGLQESAALAYKFTLFNQLVPTSPLEMFLPNELVSVAHSSPYAASQCQQWYSDNFNNFTYFAGNNSSISSTQLASPLRSISTGENAVSNAIPSRLGNTTTPVTWTAPTAGTTVQYNFGDWVTDNGKSFVCIQSYVATTGAPNEPGLIDTTAIPHIVGVNPAAVTFWAGVASARPAPGAPLPGLPWSNHPVKACINTAGFGELWLAFAQAMTDTIGVDPLYGTGSAQWLPPLDPRGTYGPAGQMPQFRNVWRTVPNPTAATSLSMSQMLKLRAAISAVNAIDLRGGANDNIYGVISSRRITLTNPGAASPTAQYYAEVYGTRPQPFISEMVVQIEKPNPGNTPPIAPFVAIELVNPYPVPITINNWQICTLDRTQAATGMQLTPIRSTAPVLNGLLLPAAQPDASGMLIPSVSVIASAANAPAPPAGRTPITMPATLLGPTIPELANVIGKEMVIVRPRRLDGQLSTCNDPADPFGTEDPKGVQGCAAMVPVDQLDLTGTDTIAGSPALTDPDYPVRLQYRRGSTPVPAPATSYAWHCVYPGVYDLTKVAPYDLNSATPFQMQGIVFEKADLVGPGNLGFTDAGPSIKTAKTTTATTYDTAPIQLANLFSAGPNPLNYASTPGVKNVHPFGQFARNGDMLQVPFIGSYTISPVSAIPSTGTVTEVNSVTMDSALAYDTVLNPPPTGPALAAAAVAASTAPVGNVFLEQIGRFCPVGNPQGANDTDKMDFGNTPVLYRYHWCEKIFNYLTVQSPQYDFYPNVDPRLANTAISPVATPARYPGNTGSAPTAPVGVSNYDTSVTNATATTAGKSEDTVGNQGLININTAPAVVLAQLPFYAGATVGGVPISNDPTVPNNQQSLNAQLARAIVADRATNGPFKSIFDLYRVPGFQGSTAFAAILMANGTLTGPGPVNGLFAPGGLPNKASSQLYNSSGVRYDFNERFLLLNNISNLITTRSDTFTCYILLQGWRGVGTSNPTLAVQRRAAFILDRNAVTPNNLTPLTFKVPTD